MIPEMEIVNILERRYYYEKLDSVGSVPDETVGSICGSSFDAA
jgi:hypothetical protein